jgi:hypothetical protein
MILMSVLIEINYICWGNDISQKGNFVINTRKYKQNPNGAVAEIVLQWINDIRKKLNIDKLIKVTYNRDHDITNLVVALDNRVYDDEWPFLNYFQ